MKKYLPCIIILMIFVCLAFGSTDVKDLKPLTAEQIKALDVNNITLQKVLNDALDRQVRRAKRKLLEQLNDTKTLTELSVLTGDPNATP